MPLPRVETSNNSPFLYTITSICIIHALILVIPTIIIVSHPHRHRDMGTDLFVGFNGYYNTRASTIFLFLQAFFQFWATWTLGRPEALSRWTLGLQVYVFALLGISRAKSVRGLYPADERSGGVRGFWDGYYWAWDWYYCGGWPILNHGVAACGQAMLLYISSFADEGRG